MAREGEPAGRGNISGRDEGELDNGREGTNKERTSLMGWKLGGERGGSNGDNKPRDKLGGERGGIDEDKKWGKSLVEGERELARRGNWGEMVG